MTVVPICHKKTYESEDVYRHVRMQNRIHIKECESVQSQCPDWCGMVTIPCTRALQYTRFTFGILIVISLHESHIVLQVFSIIVARSSASTDPLCRC